MAIVSEYFLSLLFIINMQVSLCWLRPTCDQAKELSVSCLMKDIDTLYTQARSIAINPVSNIPVSEEICNLCRSFNKTKECLEPLLDVCDYTEIFEFIWSTKVPYLGTLASLCNFDDVINEIHDNRKCYTGISTNLRRCFEALDQQPSCSSVWKGYSCSTKMAEAICASLFSQGGKHHALSTVFLRSIEPMIDQQNCSDESQLHIAKVLPEFQYRWKKETTIAVVYKSSKPKRRLSPIFAISSGNGKTLSLNRFIVLSFCLFISVLGSKIT